MNIQLLKEHKDVYTAIGELGRHIQTNENTAGAAAKLVGLVEKTEYWYQLDGDLPRYSGDRELMEKFVSSFANGRPAVVVIASSEGTITDLTFARPAHLLFSFTLRRNFSGHFTVLIGFLNITDELDPNTFVRMAGRDSAFFGQGKMGVS